MVSPEHYQTHTQPRERIYIAFEHYAMQPTGAAQEPELAPPPALNSSELRDLARKVHEKIGAINQARSNEDLVSLQIQLARLMLPYKNNKKFIEYIAGFKIDSLTGVLYFPQMQPLY